MLGQRHPRGSPHLKLVCEAGLVDRFRVGGCGFDRRSQAGARVKLASLLTSLIPAGDQTIARDLERLEAVRAARAERAAAFFRSNVEQWNRIRSLHVPEAKVEKALVDLRSSRHWSIWRGPMKRQRDSSNRSEEHKVEIHEIMCS